MRLTYELSVLHVSMHSRHAALSSASAEAIERSSERGIREVVGLNDQRDTLLMPQGAKEEGDTITGRITKRASLE